MPAESIRDKYLQSRAGGSGPEADVADIYVIPDVKGAVAMAKTIAEDRVRVNPSARPLIYIGGSTYVVSEAVDFMENDKFCAKNAK